MGPEAGPKGGKIIAKGAPEKVLSSKKSRTARFLKETLTF
jgi:excinuclease ABC subunit A